MSSRRRPKYDFAAVLRARGLALHFRRMARAWIRRPYSPRTDGGTRELHRYDWAALRAERLHSSLLSAPPRLP